MHTSHAEISNANVRQSPKQQNNSVQFHYFNFHWEIWLRLHQCYFKAINTRVTHGIPNLFHVPSSFMHIGRISLLTTRPCHGPWTNPRDSALWRWFLQHCQTPWQPLNERKNINAYIYVCHLAFEWRYCIAYLWFNYICRFYVKIWTYIASNNVITHYFCLNQMVVHRKTCIYSAFIKV